MKNPVPALKRLRGPGKRAMCRELQGQWKLAPSVPRQACGVASPSLCVSEGVTESSHQHGEGDTGMTPHLTHGETESVVQG